MQEREERLLTSRPLQVFYNGQGRTIHVSNLSSTGACLAGLRQLPVGAPVTIHHNLLRIEGQVAWSNDRLTGVQFLTPLEPMELLELQIG